MEVRDLPSRVDPPATEGVLEVDDAGAWAHRGAAGTGKVGVCPDGWNRLPEPTPLIQPPVFRDPELDTH